MSKDYYRRFDRRAGAYSLYRPSYPPRVLDILKKEIGYDMNKIIADIGSGTGLLSRLFLLNGNTVYAVEPNDDMRSQAEKALSNFSGFISVKGKAENTGLNDSTIDLVTIGQALHWFDRRASTIEFARILKTDGYVCILHNDRNKKDSFMHGYERIVEKHERDRAIIPKADSDYLSKFFRDGEYRKFALSKEQILDEEGLLGRIASSSYMPNGEDEEKFNQLKQDVSSLFREHEKGGKVRLLYDTSLFLGQIQQSKSAKL